MTFMLAICAALVSVAYTLPISGPVAECSSAPFALRTATTPKTPCELQREKTLAAMDAAFAAALHGPLIRVEGNDALMVGRSNMAFAHAFDVDVLAVAGVPLGDLSKAIRGSGVLAFRYKTVVLNASYCSPRMRTETHAELYSRTEALIQLLAPLTDNLIVLTPFDSSLYTMHGITRAGVTAIDPLPIVFAQEHPLMDDGLHMTPSAWIGLMKEIGAI